MKKTTLIEKVIGKKINKEEVMKELEAGRSNLEQMMDQRTQLQQNRKAIENAILVLEGSLILAPKNKVDLAKKEQFTNKVAQITDELEALATSIADQQVAIGELTQQHKALIEEDYLNEHNTMLVEKAVKYGVAQKLKAMAEVMEYENRHLHDENHSLYAKFGISRSEFNQPKAMELGGKVEKLRRASEEEVESKVNALLEQIEELLEENL